MSSWQRRVLKDIRAAAKEKSDVLVRVGSATLTEQGAVELRITLNTGLLGDPALHGLPVQRQEQFVVSISASDMAPPRVYVDHDRFLGQPHMLQGQVLCLYLDQAREWDPEQGGTGFLNRLWRWLDDAVAGRFDPSNALYHAVGGVLHATKDAPTLVIRDDLPAAGRAFRAYLIHRTDHRSDVRLARPSGCRTRIVPVFRLRRDLPLGAGRDRLFSLLQRIDAAERIDEAEGTPFRRQDASPSAMREAVDQPTLFASAIRNQYQTCYNAARTTTRSWDPSRPVYRAPHVSAALLTTLAAAAGRNPAGTAQYLILAVPHPTGGPPHLLALMLSASIADDLRNQNPTDLLFLNSVRNERLFRSAAMDWIPLSDERPEVTRRRDTGTPMNAYFEGTVQILGCGGIGSWIAEYVTRAGANKIILCDPGSVAGGLLVRQNFVESDIGRSKVESLARRLRAISDTVSVAVVDASFPDDIIELTNRPCLLIDATISHAVNRLLDLITQIPGRAATVAQVATDARTGTLGIANICAPEMLDGIKQLDAHAANQVKMDSALESYLPFWMEPLADDEFVPTRGCSVPTFHGSAADMAAISAALAVLIGQTMQTAISGTHLVALPQSGVMPPHRFLPYDAAKSGLWRIN